MTTTTAFFALFLINPVGMFINRRLHAWQSSGLARHYLTRYVGYLILVAAISAACLTLLYMVGAMNFGMPVGWLIFLICGSLLFNTINQTSIPSLNLLGNSRWFVMLSIATVAVGFGCAALLVKLIEPAAEYWLLGLLLGQAILAAIGTKILFDRLQASDTVAPLPAIHRRHLRTLFNFAWPVAIAVGLGWVQSQGYRYFMEAQLGLAQLGLFIAGYGISMGMIAAFESVLTTYFQPYLYRDISTANPARQAQAWREYAAVVIPSLLLTVAFVVILAPELTRIFLGNSFQSAAAYVVWGALAEAARVLTGAYSLIAHVHMRTQWLILPNLMGAIISAVLCSILIPVLGAAGAGIGLTISGLAVVVAMHVMLGSRVEIRTLPIRPVLIATALSAALWIITIGIRRISNATEWWFVIGITVLIGTLYLGLQYLLLREHLKGKREA